MTLLTLLASLAEGQIIKVGTSTGNNYFYIGTAGDLMSNMDKYVSAMQKNTELRVYRAQKRLEACLSEYKDKELDEEGRAYIDRENRLISRLANLTPLSDREVREHKESISDRDCIRIIIKGNESGRFWSTEDAALPAISFQGWQEGEQWLI